MKIRQRAFTTNALILWLVLSSAFCGTGALKTLYAEELCYGVYSTKLDLRYQRSAILTSVHIKKLDCQIILETEQGSSVVIAFYKYSLGPDDSLTFRDSQNFEISLGGEGFFPDERKSLLFEGPLTIHYVTNNTHATSTQKFQLTYTQVHDPPCDSDEFNCRNNKCIPKYLGCDRHNHCGDGSDQDECILGPKDEDVLVHKKTSIGITVSIFIISILGAIIFALTVVLVREHVLRKKETQQPQLPTAAADPPQVQQAAVPSILGRIRQSFRSVRKPTAPPLETASASEHSSESYEVPEMYPKLPAAPGLSGVDNPEFKSEE